VHSFVAIGSRKIVNIYHFETALIIADRILYVQYNYDRLFASKLLSSVPLSATLSVTRAMWLNDTFYSKKCKNA